MSLRDDNIPLADDDPQGTLVDVIAVSQILLLLFFYPIIHLY